MTIYKTLYLPTGYFLCNNWSMVVLGIIIRILSNSYLNVFQKILTNKGSHSSVINFYTYFGLTIIGLLFIPAISFSYRNIIPDVLIMGITGALGNYCIIKALSCGKLSSLSAINSYKPLVALLLGIVFLKELPSLYSLFGIFLIILGTFFFSQTRDSFNKKSVIYRVFGLLFSGTEAIFIKKIILLSNVPTAFLLWSLSGLIFAFIFVIAGKHSFKFPPVKFQTGLIFAVGLMQYSTNYVFSKMNVSSALALFQLSTLLNVFLGADLFHEQELAKKVISTIIMIAGAIILILYK